MTLLLALVSAALFGALTLFSLAEQSVFLFVIASLFAVGSVILAKNGIEEVSKREEDEE